MDGVWPGGAAAELGAAPQGWPDPELCALPALQPHFDRSLPFSSRPCAKPWARGARSLGAARSLLPLFLLPFLPALGMGWWLPAAGLLCALLCALLRFALRGPAPPLALPSLRGRTAIVTGGSGGIGEAAARELARGGARVVLATRNALRGEAAARRIRRDTGNPEVLFMPLDLSSLRSVRAFAASFLQREPHLHLLINNAGVSAGGTTEDGFSLPFQVNHLGHFLLTQLLLQRLQSSAPSRVVIVASSAHCAGRLHMAELGRSPRGPFAAFQDYCDSKLANVLHARQLAARLQGTGVTAYAVHPGMGSSVPSGLLVARLHRAPLRTEHPCAWCSLCTEHPCVLRIFYTVRLFARRPFACLSPLHTASLCTIHPIAQCIPLHGAPLCAAHPFHSSSAQRPFACHIPLHSASLCTAHLLAQCNIPHSALLCMLRLFAGGSPPHRCLLQCTPFPSPCRFCQHAAVPPRTALAAAAVDAALPVLFPQCSRGRAHSAVLCHAGRPRALQRLLLR
ncbi:dehydrogenase/reductase SDR family member 13 isoform X1 [Numida meleagris]|uniref:dehydrogenase/reductase SDR family member 13 isoform X1 n=1 Tax=Numida meleagris TaxID=8996 RepID=UPI000B3E33CD|nr:dehydrogenase/reductase SDR family member 13 isoform X1 [Numida meleagris]